MTKTKETSKEGYFHTTVSTLCPALSAQKLNFKMNWNTETEKILVQSAQDEVREAANKGD